jgi:benzoyl-CoA 2,3-dioxygenase component B
MAQHKIDDPDHVRALGVIDLQTVQKYLNFHYSVTLDLFGGDISSNRGQLLHDRPEGPVRGDEIGDDHQLTDATYKVGTVKDGQVADEDIPALNALNERCVMTTSARYRPVWIVGTSDREDGYPVRLRLPAQGLPSADW